MKSVAKLKDDARKNEQAEEWEQAIEAYDQVLRVTDNAEAELPLYNRIGDLYVRMGRPADAVAYYERAADHYAEAGLYNNAIALCNKALRYVPNRLELLRKLGQFSGAQGFLIDARRWYLEYAERQMKNGELDDAFAALEDFATVYEDAEIRELMGHQLRAHNRIGPAVVALKRAHALRVQAGENAAAAALKDEILKLMPDAFSVDTDALAAAPVPPPAPARERVELPGYADPPAAPKAPLAYSAGATAAEKPATVREPEPYAEPQTETPLARDDVFVETEEEIAGPDFDQDLAQAELERAFGYETAPPPVEAPVYDAVAPVETTPPDGIETEPEFEAPQSTGTQESEFSEVEGFEPEDNGFAIDLPPLDLPPLELPPLDMHLVPESEPLPFLTFDEPATSPSNDDLLPLLEFDPGPRGASRLNDLPQFETPEPMEPIDLDAAFASMKPFGTIEPKAPAADDVWKQPPAWLQPAPAEPSAPGSDIEGFVTGTESPWAEPLEFGYAPPPSAPERIDVPPPRPQPVAQPDPVAQPAPIAQPDPIAQPAPVAQPDPIAPVTPAPAAEEIPEVPEYVAPPASEVEPANTEPIQAFEPEPEPEPEPLPELDPPVEEFDVEVPEPEFFEPAAAASDPVPTAEVDEPALESWEVAGADAVPQAAAAEPYEPVTPAVRAPEPIEQPVAPPIPQRVARAEPAIPQPLIPAAEFARIQKQIHSGDAAGALERLEVLHTRLAADGRYQDAWQACELILQIEAGNVRALQQRVEYATALGQRDLLLRSYLELARYWRETGADKKGAIIYQRVLEIDPYNTEAQAVINGAEVPQTTQGYVDLLALISDEPEEASTRFVVAEKAPTGDEERDFADMLAQFRQKVSENLTLSDTNAHYDLGLAFKEMGLIDEAIAEFQTAIKGGGERLKFYEELGQCFLIKKQYNVAVNVLNRALQMPIDEEGHLIGVYYSLGRSYEELGRPAQAREAYERVIGLDINFQDASQRLASL